MDSNAQKLRIDAAFENILNPSSSEGVSVLNSVYRTVQQFQLSGRIDVACVLDESYLRAIKYIDEGGTIEKPIAWIRGTSYNYIRELSRESKKLQSLGDLEIESKKDLITDAEIDEDLNAIKLAFTRLSLKEQQLLNLLVVEELSYREVLQQLNEDNLNEPALRKRKERILKKFRKIYHEIKDSLKV